jgi:flagellar basal-body rod protein FlgG
MQSTGEPLDVAIEGDGYLRVRRGDGSEGLTRHGAMRLDTNRQLVTVKGDRVQPPITIPRDVDVKDIAIDPTARSTPRAAPSAASTSARSPPRRACSVGDSVYTPTQASGATRPSRDFVLRQGVLEGSNVDMADAMVDMMDAQRSYTLASRAIQTQDQLMEIANGVKR